MKMRKDEFIKALKRALFRLKKTERDRYLAYYSELIDDKIESGMNEAEAIGEFASISNIKESIMSDALERGMIKPKHNPLTIILLILGSPLWLAFVLALFSLIIALYVVVWAVIISICAIELSFIAVCIGSVVFFIVNMASNSAFALLILGSGLICAAISVLIFVPIIKLIKHMVIYSFELCKSIWQKINIKGRELI
ncbi:MAG: DUF1700 domain-containing protein [Oscillospiraceae bacterium]|nr:DUF1700 domain-containing protein [Oscillospiraceae bacterium]